MMTRALCVLAACTVFGASACAGAHPVSPRTEGAGTCATPRGFVVATDSATPLATAEDISDVETVRDPEKAQAALSIRLTDAAAARLRQYTTEHVGEHVVISLGDRVVAKLTVRDPVDSPVLVTGSTPEDVAQMRAKLCGS